MFPILMGLAIGAAMGGGIAALRGGKTDDILKGALIGGATGAIGGGIAPLLSGGAGAGVGAATVATEAAPIVTSEAILANAGAATNPIATNTGTEVISSGGANLGLKAPVPSGWGMPSTNFGADAVVAQGPGIRMPAPDTSSLIAGKQPGIFDSGFGKFLSENKMPLGLGAAGLLALKPQGSGGNQNQDQDSFVRPYDYDPDTQVFTPKTPIKASEFGSRTLANGGAIRMDEGGDVGIGSFMQEQINNRANQTSSPMAQQRESNPTLEALAEIQRSQQAFQPQGITQPLIQPQMAQIQQRYTSPQQQAPEAFQYQAPSFTKYANTPAPIEYTPPPPTPIAPPVLPNTSTNTRKRPAAETTTYSGPGVNGDAESYYDRYPVAEVYDYANNQPTRPFNPNEGSPEFNRPSVFPVDPSSGMAEVQQMFANQGYTEFIPDAHTDYYGNTGGDADGGLIADKHPRYAMGGGIGNYYPEPDDNNRNFGGIGSLNQGPRYPMQGYAMGGHLGGYSDGGQLLRGPGDGVSDDIPAQIGNRQPARLADGEFVVPARIVSELGNGSTDAGAKRLYAMMDRIQKNRGKTVGKGKVAVNSRSDKYLPA